MCLPYLHMYTLHPHVDPIFTCLVFVVEGNSIGSQAVEGGVISTSVRTMPCRAWKSVTSALSPPMSENKPRCTRIWRTEHSSWVASIKIELLVFGYFSSRSLCYMRIRKYKNVRLPHLYMSIPLVCLPHLYASTPLIRVYTTYTCLYHICVSTPHLRVYQLLYVSTHLHMSTRFIHVYYTSTCLCYLHMSTRFIHVYSTFTCLPHLYVYTLALH